MSRNVAFMREAAQNLVEGGIAVIPLYYLMDDGRCSCGDPACVNAGKHPWFGDLWALKESIATTVDRVNEFWSDYPWNIGIPCDQSSKEDSKHGDLIVVHANSGDSLKHLARFGGDQCGIIGWPRTLAAHTPTGGRHLYFRVPDAMRVVGGEVWADRLPLNEESYPGVTVIARGGYVCAAPSEEPVNKWHWDLTHPEVAEAPPALISWLSRMGKVQHFDDVYDIDSPWRNGGPRSETHIGNARRFVDHFQNRVRFSTGMGWGYWADRWITGEEAELLTQELAKEVADKLVPEVVERQEAYDKKIDDGVPAATLRDEKAALKTSWGWVKSSRMMSTVTATLSASSSDPRILIGPDRWDADKHLLGVKNGVIDLRSGQLYRMRPEMLITKVSPVVYDSTIPVDDSTKFGTFIDTVTMFDPTFKGWLQKALGLTLTGEVEQLFFLVTGQGGTGKSTLLDTVETILGGYAKKLDATDITERRGKMQSTSEEAYARADVLGARMIYVSELPDAADLKSEVIKPLTGDGRITGRHAYGRRFEVPITQKLWIGTNHKPFVKEGGTAIWRRVKVVPFTYVPPDGGDPKLKRELTDPSSRSAQAALNWMVEGARQYYADPQLEDCETVTEATKRYRIEEDYIKAFIESEFEVTGNESDTIEFSNVHFDYVQWAVSMGKPELGVASLRRKLLDAGYMPSGTDSHVYKVRSKQPESTPQSSSTPGFYVPES